jgi:putative oxidoreductase
METLRTLLTQGFEFGDATLLVIRLAVGGFFAVSGAHKLFNPARRQALRETFTADGVTFAPMMYLVPAGELAGGLGLALGALTVFAALGLAALCIGACVLDGFKRIPAMRPLDGADRVGDLLYLPEVLYILCLLAVLSFGPGIYSLDSLVLG